jgi:hypothetical protein
MDTLVAIGRKLLTSIHAILRVGARAKLEE